MKKLIFINLALLFAVISTANSQSLFKLNVHGGYSLALPDLKGDLKDSTDQYNTLTMNNGFNFGIDAKLYPFKKKNTAFTLSVNYNSFRTSADTGRIYFELGYAVIKDAVYKLNSISLGLGTEYSFSPMQKFDPFAGIEITGSYFTGSKEYVNGENQFSDKLKRAFRFGFAAGIGFDFSLSRSIQLTAGAKYNLANLIGKQNTFTDLDSGEYPLFDGSSGTFAAKNISYVQTYLGLSFYLNQPKKVVKK